MIASCLQTTGIENVVCRHSGFSSALVLSSQLYWKYVKDTNSVSIFHCSSSTTLQTLHHKNQPPFKCRLSRLNFSTLFLSLFFPAPVSFILGIFLAGGLVKFPPPPPQSSLPPPLQSSLPPLQAFLIKIKVVYVFHFRFYTRFFFLLAYFPSSTFRLEWLERVAMWRRGAIVVPVVN